MATHVLVQTLSYWIMTKQTVQVSFVMLNTFCYPNYYFNLDRPFVLITDYRYLWRMNIDGSSYTSSLYYSYMYGLDFDYR